MANNPHVSHPSPFGAAITTLRPESTQAFVLGSVDSVLYCIADLVYSLRRQLTYVGTGRHPRKDKISAFVVWSPLWLMKPPCSVTAVR
jgi:hypothetical protein